MFRKEIAILGTLALAVFLIVAAVASLSVREVERDGRMLALDTFPGLVNAGGAINALTENWVRNYILVHSDSPQEQRKLMDEIVQNSAGPMWDLYGRAIYKAEDRRLFDRVETSRKIFLAARTECFRLVDGQESLRARSFFENSLQPAYATYRRDAVALLSYNAETGKRRADRLIHLAQWTPFVLGGFCVAILFAGVFVGFKASLGAFSPASTFRTKSPSIGSK